jgi:hypothetical protein
VIGILHRHDVSRRNDALRRWTRNITTSGTASASSTRPLISKLPNTLVIVTLVSNFGTFLLYMMTCIIAIVAFREHDSFHGFKHVVVPVFGLIANLACMLFYLVGPFMVSGMSVKEPYIALGICGMWGLYGGIYFLRASKKGVEARAAHAEALRAPRKRSLGSFGSRARGPRLRVACAFFDLAGAAVSRASRPLRCYGLSAPCETSSRETAWISTSSRSS